MDIEKKFIQLFPKEQGWLANMSKARAKLIRKAQYDAFKLGVDVGMDWEEEELQLYTGLCAGCGDGLGIEEEA